MSNWIEINGGNARYLGEVKEFKNGLPFGIVNKTRPDKGGTYLAANDNKNTIIVCPFRDLVDSIAADKNNKYNVFKCYGGVVQSEYTEFVKSNKIIKIAVTYDSFEKLIKWISNPETFNIVVDEYHLILSEMDYRFEAIDALMNNISKFKYYTFLSATPINFDYEIDFFKNLPHYKVIWDNSDKIKIERFKTSRLTTGLAAFIDEYMKNGIMINGVSVESLFIFINSVTSIEQILRSLNIDNNDVKIVCADRKRNRILLNKYEIESVTTPNKKINFFTKKGFQGCNLFTNNGLIIVASDGSKKNTLIDISTTMEQIAGRLRENKEYHNIFHKYIFHIYSTNNKVLSDSEFEEVMKQKEYEGNQLIEMTSNFTEEQMNIWKIRTKLDADIVSIINGKVQYNSLKIQSFRYQQQLRNQYKDDEILTSIYNESDRFITNSGADDLEQVLEMTKVKLKKALTLSYEQLLKIYLDNPDEEFEVEYPEFKQYKKYLTIKEMNSLRWNKTKMLNRIADYKALDKIFNSIYGKDKFYSNKELKSIFTTEFKKYGIQITPKATIIEKCNTYEVNKETPRINGKSVGGYRLGNRTINIKNIL